MSVNKKNIVSIIMFSGLLIPFILLTDIFPFLRFGMFAEPIKQSVQTEKFILYQIDAQHSRTILDPEKIGINPNTFYYLCRNYIYRNEAEKFSKKLFSTLDNQVREIEILHIMTVNPSQAPDTIYIGKYLKNE